MEKDKRTPEQSVQDEMNNQVRKWGIDIQRVELSAIKVLKQAENSSREPEKHTFHSFQGKSGSNINNNNESSPVNGDSKM